jgi:hypothetical protein
MNEPKEDSNNEIIRSGHFVIIRRTHDRDSSRLIKAQNDK